MNYTSKSSTDKSNPVAGVETSKARQIYLLLRDRIASGRLDEGGPLPSEQALAVEHGVSRVTVRRALGELEREGLISRRRGAGTFALGDRGAKPIVADISDVLANIVAMGQETAVRLLEFSYREAPTAVARALKLKAGERVQNSVRVRIIDGKPFSYLVTHVPERFGITYTESELASRPLLTLLERTGVKVERATQDVTATLASPEVASALDVEVGSPLIGLTRTIFAEGGLGVEHLHALYRPDRYTLRMELERKVSSGVRRWSAVLPRPANEERPVKQAKSSGD
jgi:GntR family transcriptional regulator